MGKRAEMPDAVKLRCAELRAGGMGWAEIAETVGYPKSVCQKWSQRWAGFVPVEKRVDPPVQSAGADDRYREKGDDAELNAVVDRYIRSEEDAVREFKIDLTRWEVVDFECKAWTVGMKVGSKETGFQPVRQQQWAVRVKMKRRVSKPIENALDLVFARFKDAAPRWPKVDAAPKKTGEPFMAVMGLMDAHFGKYCWEVETGENYDLKIAESVFANAVEDLLAECRHRNVTKFLLPFGNDFLHIDGRAGETTRGTKQDVDGRFSKVLATAKIAAINAVERMAAVAPVQVELVAGNHDRTMAECLCHMIDARFHHCDRVTVNTSPKTRKYVRYGNSLLGLTHGDMAKAEKLTGLMAAEAKRDWADTDCHEWIIGHGHRSQKWVTKDTDSQQGTVVRMLRSLTKTDLWHYDAGFVNGSFFPAAEVYFYGRDRGYAGHALVPTRGG